METLLLYWWVGLIVITEESQYWISQRSPTIMPNTEFYGWLVEFYVLDRCGACLQSSRSSCLPSEPTPRIWVHFWLWAPCDDSFHQLSVEMEYGWDLGWLNLIPAQTYFTFESLCGFHGQLCSGSYHSYVGSMVNFTYSTHKISSGL